MGLTSANDHKQILVVALKKDAQPVLGQLRGAGHRVSLVEDLDEAQSLLESGGFQQAIVPASTLESLLERRAEWDSTEVDLWRRSVSSLAFDLESLLAALKRSLEGDADAAGPDQAENRRTIGRLCDFLRELTSELTGPTTGELQLTVVDLEGAIEVAAMTAYPSAAQRRQRLVIDVEESVSSVRADQLKLKRMLGTLLKYASSHTPPRGSVTVRAYGERDEPVICISYPGEEITQTELKRLFSPKDNGGESGGLARVHRLAAQHECRVWLESQRGSGTSLFLSLPWWSNTRLDGVASPARR